jgi:6-phosphogluconolactonase
LATNCRRAGVADLIAHRPYVVVLVRRELFHQPSLVSFRLSADGIEPVADGYQELAGDADPAQVAFSPDGSMLVITARGSDSIVTYQVAPNGTFSGSRTVESQGPTPYGFGFTSGGTLVVTEAFRAERGAAAASSTARSSHVPGRSATAAAKSVGHRR